MSRDETTSETRQVLRAILEVDLEYLADYLGVEPFRLQKHRRRQLKNLFKYCLLLAKRRDRHNKFLQELDNEGET